MNKQQKEQWIAALRSGKYRQGMGKLKNVSHGNTYFCCLGVARELFGIKTNKAAGGDTLEVLDKSFLPTKKQGELALMNDRGRSFDVIADHIEEEINPTEV